MWKESIVDDLNFSDRTEERIKNCGQGNIDFEKQGVVTIRHAR